jgi:hypothetical protein
MGWPQQWQLRQKKDFTTINTWQMHFFPLAIEVLGDYTNKGTTFFTDVPT